MKGSLCLFFLRQDYGPLGSVGCSLQRCRKQKLHRIAFHRGGGGGGGGGSEEVRLKEWNVLIQPATCLVPFFKQTSRHLLELSIVMFLSNNELTVVKQKKVIYYSTKMGRGLCPPQKKGRGPEVPPYPSTPRDNETPSFTESGNAVFVYLFPLLSILIFFSLLSLSLTHLLDWCDYHGYCCCHWHHKSSLALSFSFSSSLS